MIAAGAKVIRRRTLPSIRVFNTGTEDKKPRKFWTAIGTFVALAAGMPALVPFWRMCRRLVMSSPKVVSAMMFHKWF